MTAALLAWARLGSWQVVHDSWPDADKLGSAKILAPSAAAAESSVSGAAPIGPPPLPSPQPASPAAASNGRTKVNFIFIVIWRRAARSQALKLL